MPGAWGKVAPAYLGHTTSDEIRAKLEFILYCFKHLFTRARSGHPLRVFRIF